ncbi:GTP 3',8-cyclase MoaA [Cytophagaceae bacterium ABcell3]|nr:GTP 3',8-cyclase MoaA [Cytophagaceae bacterium ABcell3]
MFTDQYNRKLNYLRLSVTDKCNFRCFYCMPEAGIPHLPKKEVFSYEELLRISSLLTDNGVNKIRITGGEPFVRKGLHLFLKELSILKNVPELSITTNAALIGPYIDILKSIGVKSINVSLDSLNEQNFFRITRRDNFNKVYQNLHDLIKSGFDIKVNCVVMKGRNIGDIIPLAELAEEHNVEVRFLEEMPFNASGTQDAILHWDYKRILYFLSQHFGKLEKMNNAPNSTSTNFQVRGFKGSIGVIPAFSRTFCGACNRMRISANGDFRTCLYGDPALNLKTALRQGIDDNALLKLINNAIAKKPINGFAAEKESGKKNKESMSVIGG